MRRVVGERTQRERRDSDEVGGAGATVHGPTPHGARVRGGGRARTRGAEHRVMSV